MESVWRHRNQHTLVNVNSIIGYVFVTHSFQTKNGNEKVMQLKLKKEQYELRRCGGIHSHHFVHDLIKIWNVLDHFMTNISLHSNHNTNCNMNMDVKML